jgi:L-threonylcarbamoyladenylate synthase
MSAATVRIADDPERALAETARALAAGEVVVLPTETVYGLAIRADAAEAEARLRRSKGRGEDKPFQFLVADESDVERLGCVRNEAAQRLTARFWPGGLTLVLARRDGGTAGLRMPDHDWLRRLIRACGTPLLATSANLAGEPPATTAAEAMRIFGDEVALVADDGPARIGQASTVVRCISKTVEVLRPGAIPEEEIRQVAGQTGDRPRTAGHGK